MIAGVPAETYPGERRVSLTPAAVPALIKIGLEVHIEKGAGANAGFPDDMYEDQGAHVSPERSQLFSLADMILLVHGPGANPEAGYADVELARSGQVMLGLLNPLGAPDEVHKLADRGVTAFALELIPRISRSQPMGCSNLYGDGDGV